MPRSAATVTKKKKTPASKNSADPRAPIVPQHESAPLSNVTKDPSTWTTGDEPMTGAQKSYLKTLSDEAGEPFDEALTKAAASRRIDELQRKTGRGLEQGSDDTRPAEPAT